MYEGTLDEFPWYLKCDCPCDYLIYFFLSLSVISGRCRSAHMGSSFCLDPSLIQFMIIFKLAHLQPPMQTFLRLCSPYTGEFLRNKATLFTT